MTKEKPPLVRYYLEGWRFGYLVRAGRKWAIIRRILPIGAKPTKRGHLRPRVRVPAADVEKLGNLGKYLG